MPHFGYIVAENSGAIKKGEMEATDRKAVVEFLRSEGLLVISVKEEMADLKRKIVFGRKIGYLDKISFTENLATMLKAGVNLAEALDVIANESKNPRFQTIINDLKFAVENGKPLSEALGNYPKDFNPVFINLVKAGEASGKMEDSLARLSVQLKKDYALLTKIKNALIYPFTLIGGVIGVLCLIIVFVIPKLANVFAGTSYKIPLTTRLLFNLATFSSKSPFLTLAILIILVIAIFLLLRLVKVKLFLNRILFRIPLTAGLFRQIELVRFCRTCGQLLASGISIGDTLEITASGLSLQEYQKAVLAAKEKVLKGVSLSNAFKGNEKLFSGLLISVMAVGEKTGKLDQLLINLADFYEEQSDNTLKSVTSLIEPALLVIVGLLIGGMAVSIMVPIYQLIGTF